MYYLIKVLKADCGKLDLARLDARKYFWSKNLVASGVETLLVLTWLMKAAISAWEILGDVLSSV